MKYAAMIRGIGPMNPNMKGAKLVEAFESCGFNNVRPFLASGNVLFESDITDTAKLERLAEEALPRLLGFSRDVFIRSAADLQKIVDANPFGELKHENRGNTYLTVTFFKTPPQLHRVRPGAKSLPELPYRPEGKAFELVASVNGALCCVVDLTAGKTPDMMQWLERQYGKHLTTRTWSTITRMLAKFYEW
jgi:uncharacterized protein (DUF1697 family)